MDLYLYFSKVCNHLKQFFYKKKEEKVILNYKVLNEEEINSNTKVLKKENISIEPSEIITSVDKKDENRFLSRALRLVLKKTKIYDLFEKHVSDPRRIASTTYSLPSILTNGLLILLLRNTSVHAFYDYKKLTNQFVGNISRLIHSPSLPCPKTMEDLFLNLDPKELEPILPNLFHYLLRGKFFELHPEYKSSSQTNTYSLAIDAQVTHTYHDYNQHPAAVCPYCLKRTRGNTSWYLHCNVILSVIGEHKFQLPLFIYRVKAKHKWEESSDKNFKQECELSALPHVLKCFRHYFPQLKVELLLDSLYAQGTTMDLCKKFDCGYIIVRKAGSLRSLTSDIEGLKKLESPIKQTCQQGHWSKEQSAYVFKGFSHKGHSFDVIDFSEKSTKMPSKRIAKIKEKSSHWQWLVDQSTRIDNLFHIIHRGRSRWHQENFFNTLNNRGFNHSHDFSRAPNSQTIWNSLALIAFALSTLMELSQIGYLSRNGTSIINWIKAISGELHFIPSEVLWKDSLPSQLRFMFDTS